MKKFINAYLYCAFVFIFLVFCAVCALASPYALVDGIGTVQNIIEWDGVQPFTPPDGDIVVICPTQGVGWVYRGGEWTPPQN